MNARRPMLAATASLCAVVVFFALSGAPASALLTHPYKCQITAGSIPSATECNGIGNTVPGGAFGAPLGVAVDGAGHVYVSDSAHKVLDVFDSLGNFTSQITGTAPGSPFTTPEGVALDGSNNVWVADVGPGRMDKFDSSGSFLAQGTGEGHWTGAYTESIAFSDASKHLYVADSYADDLWVLNADGSFNTDIHGSKATWGIGCCFIRVAADNSGGVANGDLYVSSAQTVTRIDGAGNPATFSGSAPSYISGAQLTGTPAGAFGSLAGVAVDSAGNVYVLDNGRGVVDEFDSQGIFVGQASGAGTPSGSFGSPRGIAVSVAGNVYVADGGSTAVVDVFGPSIVLPDVTTSPASNPRPTSATLNGAVNPDGEGKATCQFLWGTSEALGNVAPCSAEVPEGNAPVAVHADISGLASDTTYYYRLQATNKNGTNPGQAQDQVFTALGAGIHDQSVSNVASTSATLSAKIDPNTTPTTYYFQYGTDASYGSAIPAAPGVAIGAGSGDLSVSQHLQGLSASMTYHYRVVAVSELSPGESESFYGPDETFTTQQAGTRFALPDGRQWELVSPPNKHGALIEPLSGGATQAAEDGGAITYHANVPVDLEPQGYATKTQLLSVRGAQGWSTQDISLPHTSVTSGAHGLELLFFSPDLSLSFAWESGHDTTLLSDRASEVTPYVRNEALCSSPATAGECYLPMVTGKEGFADVPPGTKFAKEDELLGFPQPLLGASPDLKHVLLGYDVPLTSTPTGGVYEWSSGVPSTEALQFVNLAPASEGGGPMEVNVGTTEGAFPGSRHTISDNGARIFMHAFNRRPSLYVRDTVKRETLALDAQQPGAPSNGSEYLWTKFQIASSDGSKVFFTSGEEILNHIPGRLLTAQSGKRGRDLYECEIVEEAGKMKCNLTDITPETGGHPAEVRDIVSGASEDGSYLYFVANGVLGDGAEHGAKQGSCSQNVKTEEAQSVTCNLYMYHGGAVTFIATLSAADEFDWGSEGGSDQVMAVVTARVSPDGRYFTFMSQRSLTGYDNRDANSGKPDAEVYLYDAVSKRLSCVSCNPTGGRPVGVERSEIGIEGSHATNLVHMQNGNSGFGPTSWVAANLPTADALGRAVSLYQPRLLSDSGRVFFNSSDALVPQDVNGQEDVYEYEPPGVGGCRVSSVTFNPTSGGCVGLVSSGTSPEESGFLDASKGGSDVFFLTTSRLTSQDYDNSFDVYDAHECSASAPCAAPVVPAPPCSSGDSCKAAPALQPPIFGAPPSATFTGAGNVTGSSAQGPVGGRTLTRAQKLARALTECRRKPKRKRAVCQRQARGRYGAKGARKAIRKAQG